MVVKKYRPKLSDHHIVSAKSDKKFQFWAKILISDINFRLEIHFRQEAILDKKSNLDKKIKFRQKNPI